MPYLETLNDSVVYDVATGSVEHFTSQHSATTQAYSGTGEVIASTLSYQELSQLAQAKPSFAHYECGSILSV